MTSKLGKQILFYVTVGAMGLFLLACSAQTPAPASSAVEGVQAGREVTAQVPVLALAGSAAEEVEVSGEVAAPAPAQTQMQGQTEADTESTVAPAVEVGAVAEESEPVEEKKVAVEEAAGDTGVVGAEPGAATVGLADGKGTTGIVVTGSGNASAAPDLATLNLGVEAIAAPVKEARTTAAEAMTAVIAVVKEKGVEDKDIQTGYFRIQPRYTGREVTRCVAAESSTEESGESEGASGGTQEGPAAGGLAIKPKGQECYQEYQSVITGYEVSNSITVLVRDLETVDDIIDGAVEAGGDNIRFNGLSFSLEDTTELVSEARAAAVKDLTDKAGELAGLAGVKLGNLVYLTETGAAPPPVARAEFAMAMSAFDSAGGVATPIAPGEVSVKVSVMGQYLITY